MVCSTAFAQQVAVTKISERPSANGTLSIYTVRIHNNTNKPICIPVSLDFANRLNEHDILNLGDILQDEDSAIAVSLFWSKPDLEEDPQQKPSYPVVLNPRTYLITNISLEKIPSVKAIQFEFMHAFQGVDYEKIARSYETEPRFFWMRSLKFIKDRIPIEL